MPGIRRLLGQVRLSHSGTIPSGGKQVPSPRVDWDNRNLYVDLGFTDMFTCRVLKRKTTDVESFLKHAGRESEEFASKFQDWQQLFSVSSRELKEFGIPTKMRKFILSRVEFYRQGIDPRPMAVKKPKKK
ncbi:hypothetical protein INT44_008311 [Umbelopsis vinacea]|uniref:Small ribosomal subunit protein mS41 n=1 Tax=Umbelopsis vinacea TaxID=44442 RepID=A0A8H7PX89_9FUNG|nr:hypothetical protein INT44_008311 [Umbelopsis vinacea]